MFPFVAAFVVQFLLLSLCFGIPLLTFFISCGQYLGSGLIDMWRISPIFQVGPRTFIHFITCSLILSTAGRGRVPDAGAGDGGGQQLGGHLLDVCLLQRQLRDDDRKLHMDRVSTQRAFLQVNTRILLY